MSNQAVPFRHLMRMTDQIGLLEHAEGIVPRHEHGYCVDDVARGLVVVCREPSPSPELITLGRRYLYFLNQAQAPDGKVRNRLGYDRRWHDQPGTEDCWGRCLWGLGTAAARGPTTGMREEAYACFGRAAQLSSPWPHAMAFAALGAAEMLEAWPDHAGALKLLDGAVCVIGPPVEYLGRAERGERHGVRPRRRDLRAQPEPAQPLFPDVLGRAARGSRAESPQGAAPAVLGSRVVVPPAVVAEAVANPAVRSLRLGQEVEVAASQRNELLRRRLLAADDDQPAGDVIDAVAVLVPRHDALGVFQQADAVGEAQQMAERRRRVTHAGAPARSAASDAASFR